MKKDYIDSKILSDEISKCYSMYVEADSQLQRVAQMFRFDETFVINPVLSMSSSQELIFTDEYGMEIHIETATMAMAERGYLTRKDFKYV